MTKKPFLSTFAAMLLASGLAANARAQDVNMFGVLKGQAYVQSSTGAPTLRPAINNPFLFEAFIDSASTNAVSVSTVRTPGSVTRTLVRDADSSDWRFTAGFSTSNALEIAYANGNYLMSIAAQTDGARAITLAVTGNAYPNAPHVSNYSAAQAVNAAASFTITLDAFAGGTANDHIGLYIEDTVTHNEVFWGDANGTATAFVIPANTLVSGRTYSCQLQFHKLTFADSTSYGQGVMGVGGYWRETEFPLVTTSAADTTPPALASSSPANGATAVPTSSTIAFTFNEPMQANYSITWSGNVNSANFSFQWSGDQRTLTCTYNGALPASSTISWTLNPSGFSANFRDLAGNPLPGDTYGTFSTASYSGPDVKNFGVVKGMSYQQSGSGDPVMQTTLAFRFTAFVDLTSDNTVTNATLRLPNGVTNNLTLDFDGFSWELGGGFSSQSALDTAFPNGTYTMNMKAQNDGPKAINLSLTNSLYPVTPRISNFTAAQAINAAADFTLTWDVFTGGTTNDFIEVHIDNAFDQTVFKTLNFHQPGALNGQATSVVIPVGTLAPGSTYSAKLLFAKAITLDSTTYGSGVKGLGAYFKENAFVLTTTAPSSDTDAPWLEHSQPQNNHDNVPVNSTLALYFSEPMQSGHSITWSPNVTANNFTYTWNTDLTVLFCTYNTSLPTNATITWTLNPSGYAQSFRDLAGNALPSDNSGNFTTAPTNLAGVKDVDNFIVYKGQFFLQTNATPVPVPISTNNNDWGDSPFAFGASAEFTGVNTVTNGFLQLPNASTNSFQLDDDEGTDLTFDASFTNKAGLDAAYPNGTYTFILQTVHDGTRVIPLSLPADNYPNTPTILGFSGTQTVNPSNSYTLSWTAFAGGTTNDFVMLEVRDVYDESTLETADYRKPGALNGTHTSVVIPANTLEPGRTYTCGLMFAKAGTVDTTTYPGVAGVPAYLKRTQFDLKTTGTITGPQLKVTNGADYRQVNLTGRTNRNYILEVSPTLAPDSWIAIASRHGTSGFQDWDAPYAPRRFYRVREVDNNEWVQPRVAIHGRVVSSNGSTPVVGAVVSTSLDGVIATTDATGYFFLQTQTPDNYCCTPYAIAVSKAGFQPYSNTATWGNQPRGQTLVISPSP